VQAPAQGGEVFELRDGNEGRGVYRLKVERRGEGWEPLNSSCAPLSRSRTRCATPGARTGSAWPRSTITTAAAGCWCPMRCSKATAPPWPACSGHRACSSATTRAACSRCTSTAPGRRPAPA
jgi:hypothetical protein